MYTVAVSADGRLAITGSSDHTARVWDVATGRCIRTLKCHTGARQFGKVWSVALSADGRMAVTCCRTNRDLADYTAAVWDVATGQLLRHLAGHSGWVDSVAMNRDGSTTITGSWDKTARVWDTNSGKCIQILADHRSSVWSVALSADASAAITGSRRTAQIWDVRTGECRRILLGHPRRVWSVALSADASTAITGGLDTTARVWDSATGCCRSLDGHTRPIESVAMTADGSVAVTAGQDGTGRVWDTTTGECLRLLAGHANSITSVALSADANIAVTGSLDSTMRIWEVPTGRCLRTLTMGGSTTPSAPLTVSGTARRRENAELRGALGDFGQAAPWSFLRLRTAQELTGAAQMVESALDRASRNLTAGRIDAAAVDVRNGRAVPGYKRHPRLLERWNQVGRMGRRGDLLDAWRRPSSPRAEIRAAALQMKSLSHLTGVESAVLSAARTIVSVGVHGAVVLDSRTGDDLHWLTTPSKHVRAVALSLDGRIAVTGNADSTAQVWDTVTGRCLHILEHGGDVDSVALSADRRIIITSSSTAATARIWDRSTGRCLRTLSASAGEVDSVTLSADARYVTLSEQGDMWELDWDFDFLESTDWDEGAFPHLDAFLTDHDNWGEISWTTDDFGALVERLRDVGFGWLRPTGVWSHLNQMAATYPGPPLQDSRALAEGDRRGRLRRAPVTDPGTQFHGGGVDWIRSVGRGAWFAGFEIIDTIHSGPRRVTFLARSRLSNVFELTVFDPGISVALAQRDWQEFDHPNIVSIHDHGTTGVLAWITTRHHDGVNTAADVVGDGPLNPRDAVGIISETARALDHIHRRGILHGDVRPHNIHLLTPNGPVVMLSGFLMPGEPSPSEGYCSPDRFARGLDDRSDEYALGCTLFHLLTGQPPYSHHRGSILMAHLQAPIPRPTDLRDDLPIGINDVIAKAMAKKPDQRFDTCGALAAAASEVLHP